MEAHVTGHMGPGAVERVESPVGVGLDEMAGYMADDTGRDATNHGGC